MNDKINNDSLRILLVEDNPTDALLLEVALEQVRSVKITLTLVKRLDEALLRLQAEYFDAVLLDLGLPDSSGLETFTRTQSHYPSVPILVLSGLDDEILALTAVRDGAQDYLVKGNLDSIMLARTIRYAIERKRTAEKLKASEMGYRRLFETAQEGIFILDAGTGQIIEANPFLENLLGHSTTEFIGKRLWEISPFRSQEANKVAFRTLQEKGSIQYDDLPLATKDGRLIDVEFVSNIYSVGDKQVIQCSIRDITERKRAEMALKQLIHQHTLILESVGEGIQGMDAQGDITFENPAAAMMLGWDANDLIGKPAHATVHHARADGTHYPQAECPMYATLRDGAVRRVADEVFWRQDGTSFPVEYVSAPVRNEQQEITGAVVVFRNISERKQAETVLESRTRLVSLGADVGRALTQRGPLRSILHLCCEDIIKYLDAAFARIWTLNEAENVLELQASAGLYTHLDGAHSQVPVGKFKIGLIAAERKPHLTNSVIGDPRVGDQEWARREGMVAFAGYPLIVGEQVVGVLAMFSRHELSELTIESLALVADQIALGINHKHTQQALQQANEELESRVQRRTAQLERANAETRTRARQQEAVAELGHRALTGCDMDTLLTGATTLVAVTLDVQLSSVLELMPGGDTLCIRAITGWKTNASSHLIPATNHSQAGYSLLSKSPTIVADLQTETRFPPSQLMLEHGIVSGVTVIVGNQEQPFGTLGAHTIRQRHFTQDDVHFLQSVANVLAAALEQRWVHEQLRRENSERQMALSALQEVTAGFKEAKEEAERFRESADAANLAKSEFLSRMSHELRTPLNAILGFGQILDTQNPTARQKESVGYILKGGRHLLDLINEVLDIARVEAGHLELSLEPVALDGAVPEACALMRPLAAERNIRLDENIQENIEAWNHRCVLADHQLLKQVLINLLSNAIKYNREGGEVEVWCEQPREGWTSLRVRDTGHGISPEDLPKLFMPFERLSASTSSIEGTGLGLALSQRMVTAMGGTLKVQSTLGIGTTFILELPQVASSEEQLVNSFGTLTNGRESESVTSHITTSYSVLCIEDNPSNLRLMETIFEARPEITLLAAIQGSVGLDLARQHEPDLILLDLNLPDIHGREVLARLQQSALTRDIPVVVVSADATPKQVERLLAEGARAYLTKPLDVRQFLHTVDTLLVPPAVATQLSNTKVIS